MKQVFTILSLILLNVTLLAQSPDKMSYQAVIRNSGDVLLTSTQVSMQISILQGSTSGTAVFVETQTPTTNANGMVSIEIGTGTVESGDFASIDWAAGPYYIKTETDPAGGINYTITGVSQLLSVPYALHAKTAETVTGTIAETDPVFGASIASGITTTDTTRWNNKQDKLTEGTGISIVGNTISATVGGSSNDFYLGQDTLGGIVYYIYTNSAGQQHGLIVAFTETTNTQWQSTISSTNATRTWDGAYNMNLMSNSPAKNWITDHFPGEWYLPSIDELGLLWHSRFHVNKKLNEVGAPLLSNSSNYWSSTELDASIAFAFYFYGGGNAYASGKGNSKNVRAIRAF